MPSQQAMTPPTDSEVGVHPHPIPEEWFPGSEAFLNVDTVWDKMMQSPNTYDIDELSSKALDTQIALERSFEDLIDPRGKRPVRVAVSTVDIISIDLPAAKSVLAPPEETVPGETASAGRQSEGAETAPSDHQEEERAVTEVLKAFRTTSIAACSVQLARINTAANTRGRTCR